MSRNRKRMTFFRNLFIAAFALVVLGAGCAPKEGTLFDNIPSPDEYPLRPAARLPEPSAGLGASADVEVEVTTPPPPPAPAPQEPEPEPAEETVITYDGARFSPSTVTVKAGTTVVFRNTGSGVMWVASNPHPTHHLLPDFDALRAHASGEAYSFIFTRAGTWGYHNHLRADQGGTVIVTQ